MKGRLLLDVVVGECPAILKLLAREDETLLVGWNTTGTGVSRKISLL